jgi:hypothetical protein
MFDFRKLMQQTRAAMGSAATNAQRPQLNAPRPSPQPMTYGAAPLPQPQGPGTQPGGNFGRPLGGAGATPASPNYGRAPQAPTQTMQAQGYGSGLSSMQRAPAAPYGQDPVAANQMLARGRLNAMPAGPAPVYSATAQPTTGGPKYGGSLGGPSGNAAADMQRAQYATSAGLPNPQRAAGSGSGPMVTNVGGKMFYR